MLEQAIVRLQSMPVKLLVIVYQGLMMVKSGGKYAAMTVDIT